MATRLREHRCVRCGIDVHEKGSLCWDCVDVLGRAEARAWRGPRRPRRRTA